MNILSRKSRLFLIACFILLVLFFLTLPDKLFEDDYSTLVTDKNGEYLRVFLNSKEQWHFPPDSSAIPAKLIQAVTYFEDEWFYYHPGINPFALGRAVYQNISAGSVVSGASTITMQLARISTPKDRTIFNKILEMIKALQIEVAYSKEEILNLYLHHAPYGGNIKGYKAASLRYFGKYPYQLSWAEAATLAVLPNAPGLINPVANKTALRQKRDRLLKKLLDKKIISKETCNLSMLESIPRGQITFDLAAPHLGRLLKESYPSKKIIKTTVDKKLQLDINSLCKSYSANLEYQGIKNLSVIVARTDTREVAAYIGSQDFYDISGNGQVDGVSAPRSTGSIIKPFLYGLCIDEGIILPQTKIKDIPTYYGGFSPYNYTHEFNGLVTAHEALTRSLNVPAVRLLYTYGLGRFYGFLKSAGISSLFRTPDDYGLPLIIGGAEISLLEIASLYCSLGNYGEFEPLKLIKEEKESISRQLISPGASYLILNTLIDVNRPGAEYYWYQFSNQWKIAWKTGTSYGSRDAWAVGVTPEWTIGVWAGNFTGEGNNNLWGAKTAGPLLFDIFNYLPKENEKEWFDIPEYDLVSRKVCKETGFLPGPHCSEKIDVLVPADAKLLQTCPYHKKIFISKKSGKQVCSLCWEHGQYEEKTVLAYPPEVVKYLRKRGIANAGVPPHEQSCPGLPGDNPVKIIYPKNNINLIVPRNVRGEYRGVTFTAAHSQAKSRLFWYLDSDFLGESVDNHSIEIYPESGWHKLSVIDHEGHKKTVRFHVEKSGDK